MAPALTKILKDGHGIHLSSPPASVRMDSESQQLSRLTTMDEADLQKMWLNLSLFPGLDCCLPMSPGGVDLPAALNPAPCLQASSAGQETLLLPSPASLLSLLSFNRGLRDPHQQVVFPGVPDMFLVPLPEYNSQEACLLHGRGAAPRRGPDGGDGLTSAAPPPSYSHRETQYQQGSTPFFAPPHHHHHHHHHQPTLTQAKVTGRPPPPSSSVPRAVFGEALKESVSRQQGLHCRAQGLQRRLQAVLGEHALLHCNQQLEGLQRHCQLGGLSSRHSGSGTADSSTQAGAPLPPQSGGFSESHCPGLESWSAWSSSFTELRDFSRSSQAVLRSLQEALDSEATASSSSEEELEGHQRSAGKDKNAPVSSSSSSCERRWLEERAELGSRWSWLQLRLAELEGRMQQLVGLHKHIRSNKGGVVLAESQPLTDRQIQQTLFREMAGLSCTASDADAEPCSPTRLLHNIERQSAQLSQIVNSLMAPLSFSPLSKQQQAWKGKRAFTSAQRGGDVFAPGGSKRRRLGTRRLFKADMSCVCARTRPLVTYHKPRLFNYNPSTSQNSGKSTSSLRSSLSSSSSCSCCSSCDPVALCSAPDCRASSTAPHPVLSLSFDTPLSHHLKRATAREEWSQRPLMVNIQPSSPAHYNRRSSTPLHNSHKYKRRARHHKSRVMGLSPIEMEGSARSQNMRANRRRRKRRHINRLIEDEEDVLYQLCDQEDSSDDVLRESYMQVSRKQASRGFVRKRQGESVYNINNIVIPMSGAKVEKLEYKDILTPSWRVVDTSSLIDRDAQMEEDIEEEQVEDLSAEVFAQRHLALEQREKLRWSSWGKRKCCRRPNRSGSRLSGSGGGMCSSGEEESSVEFSCAQLDADEEQSLEEWLPQTPWEHRVFPLDENEEDAMLSEDIERVPSGWSEWSSVSFTSKNSNSHLPSPARPSGATLPPGGQSQSTTPPNGS